MMKIPFDAAGGKKGVASIGSALVDLCLSESVDFVNGSGARMGGMVMADHTRIEELLKKTAAVPSVVPGGSACNTIVGVGKLIGVQKPSPVRGAPLAARFVGKRGDDDLGRKLEESIAKAGVEPVLLKSPTATGRVLSMITPDAQRSMLTYLGASSEFRPEEIKPEYFEDCAVVHIEGYLLFNPEIMTAALKAARAAGALVSLDLASFTVVEASRGLLDGMVANGLVDILLANEDEAAAFTGRGGDDEEGAMSLLGQKAPLAVMKLGKRGSVIIRGGERVAIDPCGDGRPAVDTTGAGDLWASGFLYGLVSGFDLEKCGNLASMCGYEACQVVGAHIPDDGWRRIAGAAGL